MKTKKYIMTKEGYQLTMILRLSTPHNTEAHLQNVYVFIEISELSSIMVKRLGMKYLPTVGVMKPGAAGLTSMAVKASPAAAKEENKPGKTVFELKLKSFEAASKIKIIKEIRSFTDLGLKEAKDLVEKTPAVFKKGVSKEEGEQVIEKLKAVGGKVVME